MDNIENSEQLKRYRSIFPNLILTNFLEFRLYRNGDRIETVLTGRPFVLNALRTAPPLENPEELSALLDRFLDFAHPRTADAESLAVELAKRTRLLRDVIGDQFSQEGDEPGVLTGFFEAFQTYLIGSLTPEDFADLFAQTITYGLFAARTRAGNSFNRRAAFDNIPHTIGVLRDLFRFISLDELPAQLAWCVDDLAEVMAVADAPGILGRYYREGKGSDLIVHFYETFLAQYDPDERERRGVYYTPEPVVGYIVRSLHGLLKTEFDKRDGLASDGVTLLDPAAGTMTFVARAAHQAVAEFEAKYGRGGRADFIRRHILRNFYALELMMAPYAVGHLKMSFFLDEKNPKWLQDDYVKFLRFAQWKIEQAERGVVGMITNHSYLDNPTFRGMRQSLMHTFDEIYILDLHGNSLKKETAPGGSPDQNVFDIQQGVAIAFFVKRGSEQEGDSLVHHADLFGGRESKYDWLDNHDRGRTEWHKVNPVSPFYLFVPRDEALEAEYSRFISIPELFPVQVVGLFTGRDKLTIHWSEEEAWNTVRVFSQLDPELARQGYQLGKDGRDWKVTMAQQDLRESGPTRENVVSILYRPFDIRYTYYTGRSRGFICMPRPKVMRQMLEKENLALCIGRQGHVVGDGEWNLIYCSKTMEDFNLFYRGGIVNFPLYLYLTADDRRPNLNPKLVSVLKEAHGRSPSPEKIFFYIYAILYAPSYRDKYAEFLRREFPRIPFTTDRKLFARLADLGKRLVDLHLLKSPELDPPTCRFDGQGDSVVAKTKAQGFRYDSGEQRVWVNKMQYFGPISSQVYEYRIGGYQVCDKWLKDRKERRLGLGDIRTYCRMVTAIGITLMIQQELDTVYAGVEDNCVAVEAE